MAFCYGRCSYLEEMVMNRRSLRTLLSESSIVAPGAYDAVSAKIIESLDFPAIYLTGYGASASRLGLPDYGFITQTEMVAQVSGISKVVNIPLLADADTGYGGIVNIVRTVHEFEDAQASAIHLEDQENKRCGHMQGKQVIDRKEFITKITAAVEARRDPEFMIFARTDARSVQGMDEALARGHECLKVGADGLFFDALESVEELERIAAEFSGCCLIANMVEFGRTPLLSADELKRMGYSVIIYPVTGLFSATQAMTTALQHLKDTGETSSFMSQMTTFEQFAELMGLGVWKSLEARYSKD